MSKSKQSSQKKCLKKYLDPKYTNGNNRMMRYKIRHSAKHSEAEADA